MASIQKSSNRLGLIIVCPTPCGKVELAGTWQSRGGRVPYLTILESGEGSGGSVSMRSLQIAPPLGLLMVGARVVEGMG